MNFSVMLRGMAATNRKGFHIELLIVSLLFVFACGKGPKHLSESDYSAAKSAFDALDSLAAADYDSPTRDAWSREVDTQTERLSLNLPLRIALSNYRSTLFRVERALMEQKMARLKADSAIRRGSKTDEDAALRAMYKARVEGAQMVVLVKVCRDDAAQWLTDDSQATNTCNERLSALKTKLHSDAKR